MIDPTFGLDADGLRQLSAFVAPPAPKEALPTHEAILAVVELSLRDSWRRHLANGAAPHDLVWIALDSTITKTGRAFADVLRIDEAPAIVGAALIDDPHVAQLVDELREKTTASRAVLTTLVFTAFRDVHGGAISRAFREGMAASSIRGEA